MTLSNLLTVSDWRPRSQLVTKTTHVPLPRFPVIDAHNHLALGMNWFERPPRELFEQLDLAGVSYYVDLDGGWGEDIVRQRLDVFKAFAPDRYCVFGGVPWKQWPVHGDRFGEFAAARLREQARWGVQGLKIWKNFGLEERDQHGALVAIDDPRLDPLWQTAGELGLPVLVHIADPVAFFDPVDRFNERWDELGAHPEWVFTSPPFPSFMTLMDAFARLVEKHRDTTFIGAHVGCYGENLGYVSAMLDRCPNYVIDFSARIGELGRQPYSARRFFERYADRILFGIDAGPKLAEYQLYYRFLETDDEHFSYSSGTDLPGQGRWYVHGLHLPDDVLRKVYADNARRVLRLAA
jgi:predicted TIM-barrel fold metal-dependent hydrolase